MRRRAAVGAVLGVCCCLAAVFFLLQGRSWDAFGLDAEIYRQAVIHALSGGDVYSAKYGWNGGGLPFTYPPFAIIVLAPLSLLGPTAGQAVVFLASYCCLVVIVRLCLRYALPERSVPLWVSGVAATGLVVVCEPVRSTLGLGQINLILLALVLGLDTRPGRLQGIGAGVAAAVKITGGILIIGQLVRGDRRAFARGLLTAVVLTGVAALWMPSQTREFFGSLLWDPSRTGNTDYIGNQSLNGLLERHVAPSLQWMWLPLVAAVLVLMVVAIRRHATDPWVGLAVSAIAGCLISPVSWTHHWVWALPVLAVGIRYRARPWILASSVAMAAVTMLPSLGAVSEAYVLVGALWIATVASAKPRAAGAPRESRVLDLTTSGRAVARRS